MAQGVGCRGWGRELWKGRLRKAAVAVSIVILCRVRVVEGKGVRQGGRRGKVREREDLGAKETRESPRCSQHTH